MTALIITVEHKGDRRFSIEIDNMRREDATKEEVLEANTIETIVVEVLKARAEKIISAETVQSDSTKSEL